MIHATKHGTAFGAAYMLVAIAAIACGTREVSSPASNPTSALTRVQAKDSAAVPIDTTANPNSPTGPGYFEGFVIGCNACTGLPLNGGTDTTGNSVPLPNAVVTVYRQGADGRATGDAV